MNRGTLGRRGTLSGGLATVLAAATGVDGAEGTGDALAYQDQDVDEASSHAPFRAAFLDWLGMASSRLALPVLADMTSPSSTKLRIEGVHPAIGILLRGSDEFSMWVEWDGVDWDSWLWLDVYEKPVTGGWVNKLVLEEYRVVHPTLESLWRADIFEPLLDWVNDDLARATHIAMWGGADEATWARLVRDGKVLGTKWTIEDNGGKPAYLLPVHGYGV